MTTPKPLGKMTRDELLAEAEQLCGQLNRTPEETQRLRDMDKSQLTEEV